MLASFGIVFLLIHKKRQQENRNERHLLETHFKETLLKSQLEIKEQTLQHIAYELHDNLGQIASLIKIHLNTLQINKTNESEEKIEYTKDLVRQLIRDLKLLSINLNSDKIAELGIVNVLENEVDKLKKTDLFKVNFYSSNYPLTLDTNTTIILFRMIQEIINNILKHSQATEVWIAIKVFKKMFTLTFTDNGVGYNLHNNTLGEGSGLTNLRNRAKLINAKLDMKSSPNAGTRICIELSV